MKFRELKKFVPKNVELDDDMEYLVLPSSLSSGPITLSEFLQIPMSQYYSYHGYEAMYEDVIQLISDILKVPSWYFERRGENIYVSKSISPIEYYTNKDKIQRLQQLFPFKFREKLDSMGNVILTIIFPPIDQLPEILTKLDMVSAI